MTQVLIISNRPHQTGQRCYLVILRAVPGKSGRICPILSAFLLFLCWRILKAKGIYHSLTSHPTPQKKNQSSIPLQPRKTLTFPIIDDESLYEPQIDSQDSTCRLALATKYPLTHPNKESESSISFQGQKYFSVPTHRNQ